MVDMEVILDGGAPDSMMIQEDEPPVVEQVSSAQVLPYLRRLLGAARLLTAVNDKDSAMNMQTDSSSETTAVYYVDQIARQLLAACHVSVLTEPLGPLPVIAGIENESDVAAEDDDGEAASLVYKRRRVDYVRALLRAMAPVAIHVAAHVVTICQAAVDDVTQQIPTATATAAWILFSQWLPVASHIAPLVSGLFGLSSFACPLLEYTNLTLAERWLVVEAAASLAQFYEKRREYDVTMQWFNWSPIFQWLDRAVDNDGDVEMKTTQDENEEHQFDLETCVLWHAARVAAFVLHVVPAAVAAYLERFGVRERIVPWVMHPWALDQEEFVAQDLYFRGRSVIWQQEPFPLPTAEHVEAAVTIHPYLVHVGSGLVFCKHGAVRDDSAGAGSDGLSQDALTACSNRQLVQTATTAENMSLLGAAMAIDPNPPPILICGPHGSGKSSLVRELARLFAATAHAVTHHDDQLLEIHVDEETDTKTLVGSYTTTDIPGQFEWRPGALTWAVRTGKWVLMEDIDSVPEEIQASLVQLLKERILPLGNGKYEHCHPDFRLFGTMTTASDSSSQTRTRTFRGTSGKRLLHPSLWTKVDVEPLPFSELKQIATGLFPTIPDLIVDATLSVFRASDKSGRAFEGDENDTEPDASGVRTNLLIGRPPSVRDLFKVLSRIAHGNVFERDVSYVTESQRTLGLAETVDIFVAACPDRDVRREFIRSIAAPVFGVTAELAIRYVETRRPSILLHETCTEVGRAKIEVSEIAATKRTQSEQFAETDYALRLIESIGVCIRENEPTLLVGETGCGKTTLLQHLAALSGRELIVQNLSLQTDSTDLLGGYRPLEIQHVARRVYEEFLDLFVSTFSRKQNADFLGYASTVLKKRQWKKLSQSFRRAAKLGLSKVQERIDEGSVTAFSLSVWKRFSQTAERFEQQRLACDTGLAFVFSEGALVDAIRKGKWVLLDEINLASSETLQRLCGLLDDSSGSLTLTERGDAVAIERHPDFRLFAAMNPATDAGKKDLNPTIRSRFTEMYVDELMDPVELRVVAGKYISAVLPAGDRPPEHTDVVVSVVNLYLQCRDLAERELVDGGGQKPRYTLRTLTRALTAARTLVIEQKLPLKRALYEGFELAFQGPLDSNSLKIVQKALYVALGDGLKKTEMDHPGRRPGGRVDADDFVIIKPFWIKAGPVERVDWSEPSESGRSKFILTPSTVSNLRRVARAVASGPWPILLEGPTSSGKTTLVEYIAARCGHHVVRINNHEHTDIQEYTGGFAADSKGSLSFQDGLLVQALRRGHWVILDELNLAPSEVLEALNRLLDDNRELYLAEINETVKPHPDFRLFATQNPSGAYGGRKPLSRAFRNRFVEIHFGDIPSAEMTTILEKRSACPPSHARMLVSIMNALRQRRSKSGVFLGKDGFITPRDLLRWAERGASSKVELAREGYMLLAERLRTKEEKEYVREELESQIKVKIDLESFYYGDSSDARVLLDKSLNDGDATRPDDLFSSIAPTKSLLRLVTLVLRCIKQREPVLLVGDTGCGKTTVVQLLSAVFGAKLHIVNCHATTETSDLLGGLRPVRGRTLLARQMLGKVVDLVTLWPHKDHLESIDVPDFVVLDSSEPPALLNDDSGDNASSVDLPDDAVSRMITLARALWESRRKEDEPSSAERESKRRRLSSESPVAIDESADEAESYLSLEAIVGDIESLFRRHNALFEWANGPLVKAMQAGDMILLDEMSLAEDAVLERLNSVLEPSRTLVLAEKGTTEEEDGASRLIVAHGSFQLFATMNPGGDFGKRELSPALRSRFTEIWVPPVTDHFDIDLVLERSLGCAELDDSRTVMKERMMEYVAWFNGPVCSDPCRPCSELTLSLRDVLTWARFVVAALHVNKNLSVWSAYRHGASLMHLDGLGLGTGIAFEDAAATKARAESFLVDRMCLTDAPATSDDDSISSPFSVVGDKQFGTHPFWIPTGPYLGPDVTFNLEAPTTARNVLRVLRAMQLAKPVLLEGSPGVGKTSLIGALAAASGHRLVRINLSEQTDIADLIGSDLPVPESDSTGVSRAGFRWCDGVLLTAIKAGDWVLLDELNLASQAVLEGLNSCLDHRASVYIPELGQEFKCPPSFRVFGAQNPLGQGGGRKGLPKSFLNRFTKVYVDALTNDDLRSIVGTRFPSVAKPLVDKLIDFNSQIHEDVVETCLFGQAGSPWEFNLRDIFRWCELFVPAQGTCDTLTASQFARDLYYQRFRTTADRGEVRARYATTFGVDITAADAPELVVSDDALQIGDVFLPRRRIEGHSHQSVSGTGSDLSLSLLEPMAAVARCVAMNWPCLLIGPSGVGKESLVSGLAELCNTKLVRVALSPSSDVSELVGCFEQVGSFDEYDKLVHGLAAMATECLLNGCTTNSTRMSELALTLSSSSPDQSQASRKDYVGAASELASLLSTEATEQEAFGALHGGDIAETIGKLRSISAVKEGAEDRGSGHFEWKDGVLVEAMTRGHWLYLQNANLCSSSVLDRLNPVMEPGGSLLLAECGSSDDETAGATHRQVKCHPNFRIFLSVNPEHGEVSRAMRNRCVEISLLDAVGSEKQRGFVDGLDTFWSSGLRSSLLASTLLRASGSLAGSNGADCLERRQPGDVQAMGYLVSSLESRGLSPTLNLSSCLRIVLDVGPEETARLAKRIATVVTTQESAALAPRPSIRSDCAPFSQEARIHGQARLVRLFTGYEKSLPSAQALLPLELRSFDRGDSKPDLDEMYALLCPSLQDAGHEQDISRIRDYVLSLFLGKGNRETYMQRVAFLQSLDDSCSRSLRFIGKSWHSLLKTGAVPSSDEGSADEMVDALPTEILESIALGRLPQLLQERVWYTRAQTLTDENVGLTQGTSVLSVSFFVVDGRIDRSSISCPVTPTVYPLFSCFDQWIGSLVCHTFTIETNAFISGLLDTLLSRRDELWNLLVSTQFTASGADFLGFEDTEFIVQWTWFRKAFQQMKTLVPATPSDQFKELARRLGVLVGVIDNAIFDSVTGGMQLGTSVLKRIARPIVPRKSDDWESLLALRNIVESLSLDLNSPLGAGPEAELELPIELHELVRLRHPVLFVEDDVKREILAALCMVHLTATDEVPPEVSRVLPVEGLAVQGAFKSQIANMKKELSARLDTIKIDTKIETVENLMGVQELEGLMSSTNFVEVAYGKVTERLLRAFGNVQLSPSVEAWCEHEESRLIREMYRTIIERGNADAGESSFDDLRVSLVRFVDVAVARSSWSLTDLRPYQSLIWMIDGEMADNAVVERFLRSFLPLMSYNAARRTWWGSMDRFRSISRQLELPTLPDDEFDDPGKLVRASKASPERPIKATEHAPSSTVFSLVGGRFKGEERERGRIAFTTIENFRAREMQSNSLVDILSTLEPSEQSAEHFEVSYLLTEMLMALRASFPSTSFDHLLSAVTTPENLRAVDESQLRVLVDTCTNELFREFVEPVVLPLFACLGRLSAHAGIPAECSRDYALSKVFLGLLRFHLLLPESPLDPGRKPIAKVRLIGRRLSDLQLQLVANRLDCGMSVGDFSPDTETIRALLEDGQQLVEKKKRQAKKVIERPQDSPAFVYLFRELSDFGRRFAGPDSVLALLEALQDTSASGDSQLIEQRELNWQMTTEAFCDRLTSKFAVYEDIVLPLVDAIASMKVGFRSLLVHRVPLEPAESNGGNVLKLCLSFPFEEGLAASRAVETTLSSIDLASRDDVLYQRHLGLALLSGLAIERRIVGVDRDVLHSWVNTVDRLLDGSLQATAVENPIEQIEDIEEKEFREQFPDHRKDFAALLHRDDDDESVESVVVDSTDDLENSSHDILPLEDEQKELLYALHRELFVSEDRPVRDSDRTRSFRLSYTAGYCAYGSSVCDPATFARGASSAHVMALSLDGGTTPTSGLSAKPAVADSQPDFHRDPNPTEVMRAAGPLETLMARIAQLLTAFPGNSILIALGRVADRVRKLDIFAVSVGKVMTGLEVILKHAQDWEQHASDRVRLGQPLADISRCVASWRKLELHNWPTLLRARENRYTKRGVKNWDRLYQLLRRVMPSSSEETPLVEGHDDLEHLSPGWVWKGVKAQAERLHSPLSKTTESLPEFVKVIDTFVLTSPLGEFQTRLDVIEAFALQIRTECILNKSNNGRLHLSRALTSLWRYYNQFSPMLSAKLEALRRPLETKLKDETKLAKWDEQSYYALAESSERSHRKLMRILRDYDEVLNLTVNGLLEREFCLGVRPDAESHDLACAIVPGDSAIFPLGKGSAMSAVACAPKSRKLKWEWTSPITTGISIDSYASRISHFASKIRSYGDTASKDSPSPAQLGSSEASELCDAVFERIGSLRSDKTTRPMKERALVDLFRELKEQGYTSTKWSIPRDIRRMGDVFQVPSPLSIRTVDKDFDFSALESSEIYYQRTLAELNRLRSEVVTLGSKYLTKRQMDMMVGFGEHGLLLLAQQRSIISGVLSDRSSLLELADGLTFSEKLLPLSQTVLRRRHRSFERDFALALESLSQLCLLLKSSQHLITPGKKTEWVHATVTKIDSFVSMGATIRAMHSSVVTQSCIQTVSDNRKTLEEAAAMLRIAQKECSDLGCLPLVAFETCLTKIETARASSSFCVDPPLPVKESGSKRDSQLNSFTESLSGSVQATLLAIQAIRKDQKDGDDADADEADKTSSVWDSHRASATEWASIDLRRMNTRLNEVATGLVAIHESDASADEVRSCCAGIASDVGVLTSTAIDAIDLRLWDTISFYRSTAKLQYVLLRIFRVLVSKGFCSDKTSEDEDGAEGDAAGMTFEEEDGTGMGEGDGRKDVTDQIEDEEQLLGLKDDQENEEQEAEKNESKQLDEEEADTGMEMEGDFDGEMYDMPDKQPDDVPEGEDDDEEELDREMGDDGGPNEEVIDEKMWDESDDEEDDAGQGEEKLEKDSNVEGAAAADEMMTKDDDDEGGGDQEEKGKDDSQQDDANQEEPPEQEGENPETMEEAINEDTEDNYEESHGVDVRDDQVKDDEEENDMELDENLELDDKSDDAAEEMDDDEDPGEDAGTAEAAPIDEPPADEEQPPEPETAGEDEEDNGPDGAAEARVDPEAQGEEPPDEEQIEDTAAEPAPKDPSEESQKGLGVRAQDGKDSVEDALDEEEGEGAAEEEEGEDGEGAGASEMEPSGGGGSSSGNQDGQNIAEGSEAGTQRPKKEIPNPLSNPGDATKFWHKKLNIVSSEAETEEKIDTQEEEKGDDNKQADGDFEFAGDDEKNTTQTLAGVDENEATQLEQEQPEDQKAENSKDAKEKESKTPETVEQSSKRRAAKPQSTKTDELDDDESTNDMDVESEAEDEDEQGHEDDDDASSEKSGSDEDEGMPTGNKVVSDLSQLHVNDESADSAIVQHRIIEEEQTTGISSAEASEARARWSMIQSETHALSRRLCEKLRLVMEPLVASKLRGDYRTGKRINMKRVIGYIASGYRKDKIWLRRTKPAKRNYRVLVAVDDSESMLKSGAGDMALKAMATLAVGMSQLEIGEVGVASFGNEMHLLHPFNQPFTSESGCNVVRNFKFDQQRTRTALCVESALMALDTPGDQASMQLVFMISDGRIERDSRSSLRRLIREMAERNILLAMIIVEGGDSKKNSIINMKEVTFQNGKPNVKRFIEDYPFPYYIVLDDMRSLPEVLGDALRQWFEMLTRLQGSNS